MFILVFIITILILVLIHEFGHFFTAKYFNVKVLEFGFGLPPRVFGKKWGETILSLNWIPFGGFVRLLGEDEVDKKLLEDKRSFAAQDVKKRILIVVAGVFMNLILAWVLFYIVIVAQGFKVLYPALSPSINVAQVEKDFPAEKAGISVGDRILKVDGKDVLTTEEVIAAIRSKQNNESIQVVYSDIDGNNIKSTNIVPKEISPGDKKIGVVFTPIPIKHYKTMPEKIFSGITYSYDATRYTFLGLGRVFSDLGTRNYERASQSVAGPIGLLGITKGIVNQGTEAFLFYLWFVGMMSLTLAVFNVLPIPALDGGRLFFLLIEWVTGRKPNPEFEKNVHAIGMAVLLTLIIIISFSDIKKLNVIERIIRLF